MNRLAAFALLLSISVPGAAAETTSAAPAVQQEPKPEKPKKICRMETVTGSVMPKRVCRTVEQVKIDEEAARQTRDRMDRGL